MWFRRKQKQVDSVSAELLLSHEVNNHHRDVGGATQALIDYARSVVSGLLKTNTRARSSRERAAVCVMGLFQEARVRPGLPFLIDDQHNRHTQSDSGPAERDV